MMMMPLRLWFLVVIVISTIASQGQCGMFGGGTRRSRKMAKSLKVTNRWFRKKGQLQVERMSIAAGGATYRAEGAARKLQRALLKDL